MSEKLRAARRFYAVMALALVAGMGMTFAGVNPIRMLFLAAVVNGLLAPPLIFLILLVANDRRVMGGQTAGRALNVLGGLAGVAMVAAAVALLVM